MAVVARAFTLCSLSQALHEAFEGPDWAPLLLVAENEMAVLVGRDADNCADQLVLQS